MNEEIFSDLPLNIDETFRPYLIACTQFANELRKHGWAFAMIYEDGSIFVFSEAERVEWLRDGTDKIGVKVSYNNDMADHFEESYMFNEGFYTEWSLKNLTPIPDVSRAIWTIMANCNNIRTQLSYIGAKPAFKHYILGTDVLDNTAKASIDTAIRKADALNGFGASRTLVEEIKEIKNTSGSEVLPIYDKFVEAFASATRLPLSFYTGESKSTGLSTAGESNVDARIKRKKDMIFMKCKPFMEYVCDTMGISYGDIQMAPEYTTEDVQNEGTQDEEVIPNAEETERTDQSE